MSKGDSRMNSEHEACEQQGSQSDSRRPYVKPAFSSERVFEVNALACTSKTSGSCHSGNRT
jgi:hypothetical protein